jgi:peptidoglycan/xylan/chitin deacetylase (PgdA/CDA1 family)
VVSTAGFRRHLELIRSRGYTLVSMTEALRLVESGLGGRGQYVCVTFDDGRLDNLLNAWPILREFDATAHFFVSTGLIGASASSPRNGVVDRYLTVEHLRKMLAEGASVGSHGRSHTDLTTLDARAIGEELATSRGELEALLDVRVLSYAYAYARYDRRILQQMRAAGYRYGFTINTGTVARADEITRFTLPRNVIRSGVDDPENAPLIQGGMDFAHPYSTLKRRVRFWR